MYPLAWDVLEAEAERLQRQAVECRKQAWDLRQRVSDRNREREAARIERVIEGRDDG